MTTPATTPNTTQPMTAHGTVVIEISAAAPMRTMIDATINPRSNAPCTLLSSSVRTANVPRIEATMPMPARSTGNTARSDCRARKALSPTPHRSEAVAAVRAQASAIDAMMLPT